MNWKAMPSSFIGFNASTVLFQMRGGGASYRDSPEQGSQKQKEIHD